MVVAEDAACLQMHLLRDQVVVVVVVAAAAERDKYLSQAHTPPNNEHLLSKRLALTTMATLFSIVVKNK
jgi:hypothetical protein